MTITKSPSPRRRRTPVEVRSAALDAARALLLEGGPASITLTAVAGRLGMAHGNVAHHFGSAAGLQSALAEQMIRALVDTVADAVVRLREAGDERLSVIDLVFDAFDAGGSGQLIAWLASSGQHERLVPLCAAVAELVDTLRPHDHGDRATPGMAIMLVLLPALGNALIGGPLRDALAIDERAYRAMMVSQLEHGRADRAATNDPA